jgi:hypothetical protein
VTSIEFGGRNVSTSRFEFRLGDQHDSEWTASKLWLQSNSVASEPAGSSPYLQQSAIGPYREPTGSTLHPLSQCPF